MYVFRALLTAFIVSQSVQAASLNPIDPRLPFDDRWMERLEAVFNKSSTKFSESTFESYKIPSYLKIAPTHDDPRGLREFPSLNDYGQDYFETYCQVGNFRNGTIHDSFLYKSPNSKTVFSGDWVPKKDEWPEVQKVMQGGFREGEGYVIEVKENNIGIYSDFKAPISVIFRLTPRGNLIGQFVNEDNRVVGYKLCGAKPRYFCFQRGKTHEYDEFNPSRDFSILVSESSLREAQDKLTEYVHFQTSGLGKVKKMSCGTDLKKIKFEAEGDKAGSWVPAVPVFDN